MNRREKFDAASFMLGGEIRKRTNTQRTQTVTDISTPCLSACVDNELEKLSSIEARSQTDRVDI